MNFILSDGAEAGGMFGAFEHDGPVRINMELSNITKAIPFSGQVTIPIILFPDAKKSVEVYDPMIPILGWFASLPKDCHEALFTDFEEAAKNRNLRSLLDAISDWAATAELYANPEIAGEVREAIGGREGVLDWLNG